MFELSGGKTACPWWSFGAMRADMLLRGIYHCLKSVGLPLGIGACPRSASPCRAHVERLREESSETPDVDTKSKPEEVLSAPDNRNPLQAIRDLCEKKMYGEAVELLEHHFSGHLDARDEWNHPIYYKEKLRIALLRCQYGTASDFAAKLQPLLDPGDPAIQLLYGRQHRNMRDILNATRAYEAALARCPSNQEAREALELLRRSNNV
jgi:hypothetical protein